VGANVDSVLSGARAEWSAYTDDSWRSRAAGDSRLQRRVRHLLAGLGLDPWRVPSSNLIFVRSARGDDLGSETNRLIEQCWPVHQAVVELLRPRAVIAFGRRTYEAVRKRFDANQEIGSFEERNKRRWTSRAWYAPSGLIVFGLTHPSVANWINPATDPSSLARDILGAR
jgi:uracil-DNA glycosylase